MPFNIFIWNNRSEKVIIENKINLTYKKLKKYIKCGSVLDEENNIITLSNSKPFKHDSDEGLIIYNFECKESIFIFITEFEMKLHFQNNIYGVTSIKEIIYYINLFSPNYIK
jgi:hypothetical protein